MDDFGLSEKSLGTIQSALASFPEISSAKVYGSRAMGNCKQGSDIDIALFGPSVTARTRDALFAFLDQETMLPYKFDILVYDLLENRDLKKHIDEEGRLLYRKPENP